MLLGPGFPLLPSRYRRLGGFGGFCLLGFFLGGLCNFHRLRGEIAGDYITYSTILFYPDLSPIFNLSQLFHFCI